MHIVNTLVPVFLLIGLGLALRKSGFLSGELVVGLNKLVYWVGLPALLFIEIGTAAYRLGAAWDTFLVVLAATMVCVGVGYAAGFILKVPGRSLGTFVQGAFRSNNVYIGLPVVTYSLMDMNGVDSESVLNIYVLVVGMIIPVYNVLSVTVLLTGQERLNFGAVVEMFKQLAANPLILACVAGILWAASGLSLPWALNRAVSSTGQMALPLALIATGATMTIRPIKGRTGMAIWSSLIRVAVGPVAGLGVARLMGLGSSETHIALIMLACPTAVASFVLSDQLKGDSNLAADIIVISSLFSIGSLAVVLATG